MEGTFCSHCGTKHTDTDFPKVCPNCRVVAKKHENVEEPGYRTDPHRDYGLHDTEVRDFRFYGPGLSRYEATLELNDYERDGIHRMLARAYEAGKTAGIDGVRRALGIANTPWGVKVG